MRVRRVRPERFGAFVATEEPFALISVDRALARRLGVDGAELWREPSREHEPVLRGPTEVHLAVTERCPAACTGCYADARPDGDEPAFDVLRERLDAIAAMGAFSVALGGGEGALREDLPDVIAHARALGLVPTLTTSGLGVTKERARRLSGLAQVNVSYDGPPGVYEAVRGYAGAAHAERAIEALREVGVPVGMNTVLTRASFAHLDAVAARASALGVVELQLLRFKPSGRGKLDYLATRLTEEQVDALPAVLRALVARYGLFTDPASNPASDAFDPGSGRFALRVDCAMVPFLAADPSILADDLARFGVIGCEPGRSLLTIDVRGDVRPCSFWRDRPATPLAPDTWSSDPTLESFRDFAESLPEPCASCAFVRVCRGGCRIVAGASGDPFRPDPECPKVRAFMKPTAQ
ncbi:MAG: radical SAM protein [Myxococcota bacterium]|jgi:radical SAM protein with 4Fe4S-binding SPASM domain|nr:radical SAM protein [Myxococcota bacterium]